MSYPSRQLLQQPRRLQEIVAVVGVAHNDVPAARRADPAHERAPVAPLRDCRHPCAHLRGDLLRPVGTAVICHNDLARYSVVT